MKQRRLSPWARLLLAASMGSQPSRVSFPRVCVRSPGAGPGGLSAGTLGGRRPGALALRGDPVAGSWSVCSSRPGSSLASHQVGVGEDSSKAPAPAGARRGGRGPLPRSPAWGCPRRPAAVWDHLSRGRAVPGALETLWCPLLKDAGPPLREAWARTGNPVQEQLAVLALGDVLAGAEGPSLRGSLRPFWVAGRAAPPVLTVPACPQHSASP